MTRAWMLGLLLLTAGALPPQAELDRSLLHAKVALDAARYDQAEKEFAAAARQGLPLPEDYYLGRARALGQLGRSDQARGILEAYLKRFGAKSARYKDALTILVAFENGDAPPPSVSPPAQRQAGSPSGAKVAASTAPPSTCGRPRLPFAVDPAVWARLEASDAYRLAPPVRPLTLTGQYEGVTKMKAFTTRSVSGEGMVIKPLTPCVAAVTRSNSYSQVTKGPMFSRETPKSGASDTEYMILGGLVPLGADGGKGRVLAIDEISGSLFPLREDATLHIAARLEADGGERRSNMVCKVGEASSASAIDGRLTGKAWPITCRGASSATHSEVYLEDLGAPLRLLQTTSGGSGPSHISQVGARWTFVSPTNGTRLDNTWTRYDWR